MRQTTPLLLFLLLLLRHVAVNADLNEHETSSLLSLRDSLKGRLALWNGSRTPCAWDGVVCAPSNDTVLALRLPGMGLAGRLPSSLSALSNLQILSLRFNSIAGSLPAELGNLTALRVLNLKGNRFSGNIPVFVFGLSNLVKINLAENRFNGSLPKDFAKLSKLREVYLEGNRFTGGLPKSGSLASIDVLNVTGNDLSGRIPHWASKFPADAFGGNRLCGVPLSPCKKRSVSGGAIAGIVIGGAVVCLLVIVVVVLMGKKGKREEEEEEEEEEEVKNGVRAREVPREKVPVKRLVFFDGGKGFDLEDLLRASAEVLGKGTFGTTYKANIDGRGTVAVKRLKEVGLSGEDLTESLSLMGKMTHENVISLRAYYLGKEEKLLVYDYLPMGSLSALLHGNRERGKTRLTWSARARIAIGAAAGIEYIHSQSAKVVHGNLRSSNILVTNGVAARVSDSLLSRIAMRTGVNSRLDGYRAPEVGEMGRETQKGDVYSLGVVILELLTGKAPRSVSGEEGVDLVQWVKAVVREEWTAEVFDEELVRYQGVEEEMEEMVEMLQLAVDCTAGYPEGRPTIGEVRRRMEEICRGVLESDRAEIGSE